YPADAIRSPVTEFVAARLRAIAAAGDAARDDVFLKAGASGTVSTHLLYCLAGAAHQPQYTIDLGGREHLQATLAHFRAGRIGATTPFDRATLAAEVGRTARWVLTGDPSPLAQELAAATPRFAFVNYGTNDMGAAASYGAALAPFWDAMNELLDQLEAEGVVTIVSGLNPRSDRADAALWVPTWDAVTRALAEARQLPYISLYVAAAPLPDMGLVADGIHGNVYSDGTAEPCVFDAAGLAFNYNLRNLASLEALDAVRRVVLDDAAAPDLAPLPPVTGAGTAADPFVIDRLPFTHSFTTVGGERARDGYPDCDAGQDERGPEITYRLDLAASTPVRAIVLDRGDVDVDLHVLAGEACLERSDRLVDRPLSPGAHRLVVDTFTSSGGEHAGAYTLVVLPCAPGDPACAP
ncbi:MAG: SGNH/GDSL hydrolase family protein, partial [Deltaproteobacteria bacterium]|nr:SGNH/GDSL hydrolase family protein [Kofleriaceae bacterium]